VFFFYYIPPKVRPPGNGKSPFTSFLPQTIKKHIKLRKGAAADESILVCRRIKLIKSQNRQSLAKNINTFLWRHRAREREPQFQRAEWTLKWVFPTVMRFREVIDTWSLGKVIVRESDRWARRSLWKVITGQSDQEKGWGNSRRSLMATWSCAMVKRWEKDRFYLSFFKSHTKNVLYLTLYNTYTVLIQRSFKRRLPKSIKYTVHWCMKTVM